jgi:hypothetical protein
MIVGWYVLPTGYGLSCCFAAGADQIHGIEPKPVLLEKSDALNTCFTHGDLGSIPYLFFFLLFFAKVYV